MKTSQVHTESLTAGNVLHTELLCNLLEFGAYKTLLLGSFPILEENTTALPGVNASLLLRIGTDFASRQYIPWCNRQA